MANVCGKCETTIDRRKTTAISCSGFCSKPYHAACCGISSDIIKYMKTPGLHWYCENCDKIKSDYENILKTTVESRLNDVMIKIEQLFDNTRHEILQIAEDKFAKISIPSTCKNPVPLYSQVVDNKSVVIIKPKNLEQPNSQTKCDVMNSINPVEQNINVSKVKNLSNGGLLIGCNNTDSACKFKQLAKQKLSANYDIREAKKGNFRVKIVGMMEEYGEEQLLKFIKHQNEMFSENSECKISKIWPLKKNNSLYQAVVDVDAVSYCKALKQGYIFVNYDVCKIYDAIELKICFKCSGLNHYEKACVSISTVCPKCSLSHNIKDCPDDAIPRCINCVNAKIADNGHFVWESDKCTVYKKKLTHYKETLFGSK